MQVHQCRDAAWMTERFLPVEKKEVVGAVKSKQKDNYNQPDKQPARRTGAEDIEQHSIFKALLIPML